MKIVNLKKEKDFLNYINSDIKSSNDKLDSVKSDVLKIINDIKEEGDEKIKYYLKKFDKVNINNFLVSEEEIDEAYERIDKEFLDVLNESFKNITNYHKHQKYSDFKIEDENKILTQIITPIESALLYIPGGKNPYPSTVLMNAIPANLAGVKRVVITTPANKEGNVPDEILAAAKICGVKEIYKIGGAVGIAAFAYGTKTIKPVSKICGPGNLYVAAAKKEVYGDVDIDMIAGPSEILIIATKEANEKFIAADLLSQAEHDENASAILVTDSETLANKVKDEVYNQMNKLNRADIMKSAINNYSRIYIVKDIMDAFDISNELAPEHLEIMLKNPKDYIKYIKNAGSVFLGEYTPEPVGDYFSGTNHTIPTSGKAKFASPLGVYDFLKRSSVSFYSRQELLNNKDKIILFAEKEGLDAHANSIKVRFPNE